MRKLVPLLLFLLPFNLFAQIPDSIAPYINNYVVKDRSVSYVKVYELEGKSKADIKNLLISSFSGIPKITINQNSISDDQIVGTFTGHRVDYKKYGGKWGNTSVWVLHPMSGKFTFQVKDNRYRLIVSDVISVASSQISFNFNTDFAKKDNTLSGVNTKSGYMGYYHFARSIEDIFNVSYQPSKSDW